MGLNSWVADAMLDAVERWAVGTYWLVRETQALVEGRIDGLLVPDSFRCPAVAQSYKGGSFYARAAVAVGVEIKASRQDFQRGLREGQFDRYQKTVSGLYVVTTKDVKPSEVPRTCGHIVVGCLRRKVAVCRRHPTWDKAFRLTAEQAVNLMHMYRVQSENRIRKIENQYREKLKRLGELAGDRVFKVIRQLERQVAAEIEEPEDDHLTA